MNIKGFIDIYDHKISNYNFEVYFQVNFKVDVPNVHNFHFTIDNINYVIKDILVCTVQH